MTNIHLTDDDTKANRLGLLSTRQRQMVHSQRLVWIAGTVGFVGVVLGLMIILLTKFKNPDFADRGELFIIIPVMLFWLWILRRMPYRWRLANLDLFDGTIKFVEGTVEMNIEFGYGLLRSIYYSIQVKNHSFRITKAQQRLIKSSQNYRIYHTAYGHQFLSAIELEKMKNIPATHPPLAEPLTSRELEVLQLLASGLTNQQIAIQLSLSVNTIKMYTSQLYSKLDVKRRTEAIARARELNLL